MHIVETMYYYGGIGVYRAQADFGDSCVAIADNEAEIARLKSEREVFKKLKQLQGDAISRCHGLFKGKHPESGKDVSVIAVAMVGKMLDDQGRLSAYPLNDRYVPLASEFAFRVLVLHVLTCLCIYGCAQTKDHASRWEGTFGGHAATVRPRRGEHLARRRPGGVLAGRLQGHRPARMSMGWGMARGGGRTGTGGLQVRIVV